MKPYELQLRSLLPQEGFGGRRREEKGTEQCGKALWYSWHPWRAECFEFWL